ncbi:Sec-independent protein translocase protein TatB [Roseovarius sp. D22-M7]|uniref:Sec-independent protein translocase protein TatB n=1 Tax=Roseovarius sp. D22-M7 TaxID=3127116 RepID=UPI003010489B
MLDLGWTELLLIGIVALIVVGPKDLPGMFQAVGRFVGKAKGMAREFSRAMNDAADQSGVSDIQKSFKAASNPMKSAMDEVRKTTDSVTRDAAGDKKAKDKTPLGEERKAQAEKIREKSAEMAEKRKTAEAEDKADDAAPVDAADAPADDAVKAEDKA